MHEDGIVGPIVIFVLIIIVFLLLVFGFGLLMAIPLMWAWNYLVNGVFEVYNIPTLNFWSARCLSIVFNLLIKSHHFNTGGTK